MFRVILFLLIFLSPLTPAQASNYVKCTSANLDLTFEINSLFKTVRNVDYNTKMNVGYWSEEAINTEFSINKSLGKDNKATFPVSLLTNPNHKISFQWIQFELAY